MNLTKPKEFNMFRKSIFISVIIFFVISLVACTSTPVSSVNVVAQKQTATASPESIESKLGIGILKMEGTNQAVTASQASTLLPLWKAVNALGNDKNASKAEVAALYTQIQETLTSDQANSIQQLTWTQQELSEMMQKYGSTQSTSSSVSKSSTSSTSSTNAGGPPDMGGMPGGGPMGDITSVGSTTSGQTSSSKSSASAKTNPSTPASIDYNPVFASAVVTILKQRVSVE
jgi:hypothetical protein